MHKELTKSHWPRMCPKWTKAPPQVPARTAETRLTRADSGRASMTRTEIDLREGWEADGFVGAQDVVQGKRRSGQVESRPGHEWQNPVRP